VVSNVVGLQNFGINLKDAAKLMGKKFACGATATQDEVLGELIQVQGMVSTEALYEFLQKEFASAGVPEEALEFKDGGNQKGRKKQ